MTDDFLSNNNYYNKGGLNGKPKVPRPEPPKGQSSDNKYELTLKQLIHERNKLIKDIINICKLLDINTDQSVLGANCLEFYTVRSLVAEDKIKELQKQLQYKEQECNNYKQALKEIEDIADDYNRVEKTSQYYRDGFDQIQDILNGVKEW